MTLHTDRLRTLQHVREFLEGNQEVDLVVATRAAAYGFIEQTLGRFDYVHQGKAEKGLLRCFLAKVTGLSRVTRLLAQHRVTGSIADRRGAPRRPFPRRYTSIDIGLLAELDRLHGTLSAGHAQALCARLPSLWRPPVRTPGRHLQRPPLQPAALDHVSTAPRNHLHPDAPSPGRHWRAPSADAVRAPRLCPGRFRPPSRSG